MAEDPSKSTTRVSVRELVEFGIYNLWFGRAQGRLCLASPGVPRLSHTYLRLRDMMLQHSANLFSLTFRPCLFDCA